MKTKPPKRPPYYTKGMKKKREHFWCHAGFLADETGKETDVGVCDLCGKGRINKRIISVAEYNKITDNPRFRWGG